MAGGWREVPEILEQERRILLELHQRVPRTAIRPGREKSNVADRRTEPNTTCIAWQRATNPLLSVALIQRLCRPPKVAETTRCHAV